MSLWTLYKICSNTFMAELTMYNNYILRNSLVLDCAKWAIDI